jgi:hypothetical protein
MFDSNQISAIQVLGSANEETARFHTATSAELIFIGQEFRKPAFCRFQSGAFIFVLVASSRRCRVKTRNEKRLGN